MSEHSKRCIRRSLSAMSVLTVACAGTSSLHADIVIFNNVPTVLGWTPEVNFSPGRPLDITQPATQGTAYSYRSLWWYGETPGGSGSPYAQRITNHPLLFPSSQVRIARSTTPTIIYDQQQQPVGQTYGIACFQPGDTISSSADWRDEVTVFYGTFARGNLLSIGHSYFGIEVPMADGVHYGFIEVTGWPGVPGPVVLSWGYETQPNTPAVIPGGCGTADFDGDGDFGTDADIEAFFACLAGSCCQTCWHRGSDFNNDGDSGTDADIEAFFRVLSGNPCM